MVHLIEEVVSEEGVVVVSAVEEVLTTGEMIGVTDLMTGVAIHVGEVEVLDADNFGIY